MSSLRVGLALSWLFLALATAPVFASPQDENAATAPSDKKQPAADQKDKPRKFEFMRLTRDEKKQPVSMDTAIVTYVGRNAQGEEVRVDLIGAVQSEIAAAVEAVKDLQRPHVNHTSQDWQPYQQHHECHQRSDGESPSHGGAGSVYVLDFQAASEEEPAKKATANDDDNLASDAGYNRHKYGRHNRQGDPAPVRSQCLSHAPYGQRDHCNGNNLQPAQPRGVSHVACLGDAVGKQDQKDGGWEGEPQPGRQAPQNTGPRNPNANAHLAAGRPWEELTQSHQVSIGTLGQPFAPLHVLGAEVAEMGYRTTEGG